MIHPSCKGINLNAKQLDTANEWITTKEPSFIASLISYQAQALPLPSTFFNNVALKCSAIDNLRDACAVHINCEAMY